ncbi:hypothetical protein FKM82_002064 [Ascaphus truei]
MAGVMAPAIRGLCVVDTEGWILCSAPSLDQVSSAPFPCPLLLSICSMAWTTSPPQPCRTSSRTLLLWVGNTLVRMSMGVLCLAEDEELGSCSSFSASEPDSEPRGLMELGLSSPSFRTLEMGELRKDSPSPLSEPEPGSTSGEEAPGALPVTDSLSGVTGFPPEGSC